MCIVIDANVAHHFNANNDDAILVRDWIEAKPGRLATGGRNVAELSQHAWMRRWFVTLIRAGRLKRISDSDVTAEEQRLFRSGICQSDDPHIVALARRSGARILYSHDQALHQDFGNKDLIDNPRGSVYQCANHKHLLDDRNCCTAPL
jgi:hypothetical protein